MIYRYKPKEKPNIRIYTPAVELRANAKSAEKETQASIAFYADPKNQKESFKYSIYKNEELKEKLEAIFKGKCAYCETRTKAGAFEDIEHFRPKGTINTFKNFIDDKGSEELLGYYWLASDWDNLFISCQKCNRGANEKIRLSSQKIFLGKKNRFPLSDENKRVTSPFDSIESEKDYRLIINPCKEDPELLFDYIISSKRHAGIITSKQGLSELERKKVRGSILVYGLNRADLVLERKKVIQKLWRDLYNLDGAIEIYYEKKKTAPDNIEKHKSQFIRSINGLRNDFKDSSEYLGLKRYMIREAMDKNSFIKIKKKYNIDLMDLLNISNLKTS